MATSRNELESVEDKMADSSDEDAEFGQQLPPLHIYLKRVLDKYPEGGQILKELVQNADDANAKNVIFLYDKSVYPNGTLWSDTLKDFQGPALYAYNDSVFEKKDWDNIQHPEQSDKLDDLSKIGRFGLGFISVYHLTDMPCIVSGNKIGFLDPLEKHFLYDPHTHTRYKGRRGKKWKMSPSLLTNFPDQFSPFINDLFGCTSASFTNGRLQGTIFRFPLRTTPSNISKSVFTDEARVDELLQSFQRDAEISLLFLKHVESISVYKCHDRIATPSLVGTVQISPKDCGQLLQNRAELLSSIKQKRDCQTVCCVHIEKSVGPNTRKSRYIIVNSLKMKSLSHDLQTLTSDDELRLLAWMGVSFQVSTADGPDVVEDKGRVFCFLPLPENEQTGLPIHVHGYFGLGDNRRSIKWPDQESQHDNKAQWNKLLSTEVFPAVYATAILAAIDKCKDPNDPMVPADVYRGWPHTGKTRPEWSEGVKNFLQIVKPKDIVFSESNGAWMKLTDVYIDCQKNALASKVLRHKGCAVAQLPDHVVATLAGEYREVTPAVVRKHIQRDKLSYLTRQEKLQLLQYVMSDTMPDLDNLWLLPLQNGDFTCFSKAAPPVYIETGANPSRLIPNSGVKFAASDLPRGLTTGHSRTQLRTFKTEHVLPLLLEMLPSTWRKGTDDTLLWTPGIMGHPSKEWLAEIWNWLCQNHLTSDLGFLEGVPLIPIERNLLARLQKKMIFQGPNNGSAWLPSVGLTDNVCSFLSSVGAVVVHLHVLNAYPRIVSHPHLSRFIQNATPEGVMNILEVCSRRVHLLSHVDNLSVDGKNELRDLLAQLQHHTPNRRVIMRPLPMFLASDGQYVSAQTCTTAVPLDCFGIPTRKLRRPCILLSSNEWNLLQHLGVHKQSVSELLIKNILPAVQDGFYSDVDALKITLWVLHRPEHDMCVKEFKLIPTCACKAKPGELFEPNRALHVLLRGSDVFPTGVFAEGKVLNFLKRVGLKDEKDVTATEILRCAKDVSETQAKGQADVERGSVILNHLNCYPHLLNESVTRNVVTKPLRKFLEDLCWVPCEAAPPREYPNFAGWAGMSNTLYAPRVVGLIESALLQGSILPLLNLAGIKRELLNAFSWSKEVDHTNFHKVEVVVRHLTNVSCKYQPTEEAYVVCRCLFAVYTFLSKANEAHLVNLFDTYFGSTQPWVWHGSGFTTPTKIAFSTNTLGVSLTPYLHTVPPDLLKYRSFLTKMGVQDTFQENALCAVLQDIHQRYEDGYVPSKDKYDADLLLVCNILRHIVNQGTCSVEWNILVPCRVSTGRARHLQMEYASQCLYVDEERLAMQLEDIDKPLIHELVPNQVAQRLGLKPLSHYIAPVESLEYGYDLSGPHETAINAIRRNLDMYKKGVDIFKEMIQNADDAGATEVKFLFDWRRNESTTNNLLSEGMKACHGPALWAFNNKRFSEQDIKNICSIAEQSKKQELDKVGRFGLGFTSVYHLTDVPSIVSGPHILICDPLTTHLGSRINSGQPGIRLDLRKEAHRRTLKSYPNQFAPYIGIFNCNPLESTDFEHTLFRLPLRTKVEASGNKLSENVCDSKTEIDPLIESLKRSATTLLLFTQNVVNVSVYELQSEDFKDRKTIMSVSVSRVRQMPRAIAGPTGDMRTERNLLVATAECLTTPGLETPETTMIVKVTQETWAKGRRANSKPKIKASQFIISSCMARGQASDLAVTPEGRAAGVLPCGGVAVQLDSEGQRLAQDCTNGSVFSYLPLGVLTGLPFHVNGGFLLQPNRRQLWSKPSSGSGEFETRWNICLMQSVLLQAFVNLLEDLKQLQRQDVVCNRNFQLIWPTRDACESDFYPFVDAYYQRLGSETHALAVLFSDSRWVSVHDCFFLDCSQAHPEILRRSIKVILTAHQDPKRCVELTSEVTSSIVKARANKCFDANTFHFHRFLKEVFFPMLQEGGEDIDPIHRNNIVLHMLDHRLGDRSENKLFDANLKGTCCIPTSPDGDELSRPDELVDPSKWIGPLYSDDDGRFPHREAFQSEDRLLSLKQLGMASTTLPWTDVCERAKSISTGKTFDQRTITLLKLIDVKLRDNDQPDVGQKNQIRNAAFLPVMRRPENYPVDWRTCNLELMSADELYECRHQDLLGSVKFLLDEERCGPDAMSPRVKTFLGFSDKKVVVGDVIEQLKFVISKTKVVTHETSTMTFQIYGFLQEKILAIDETDELEYTTEFDQLSEMRFVLCHDEFRECKQLAFQYNGKNGPYLYQVPLSITRFSNLLKSCGVRDQFEVTDFVRALHLLKDTWEDRPLDEADFKTAKAMLTEIVTRHGASQENLRNEQIFVPDSRNILQTPSNLTYNDMPWRDCQEKEVYTHPDISYNDAQILGIITRRHKLRNHYSSLSDFEMDFGQSEDLTDRLINILRSYPNVSDVFKELLQNADDAGSTEIHFVYDPRSQPTEKIISKSWTAVQSLPSLCVYNDKSFTEADIKGIQKLGIGGKRDDIATTGKFGIGFNAVYHLTDYPSFLSNGDTLCVFDPLLKVIESAQNSSPGRRYKITAKFREDFPDMLGGYLEDVKEFSDKTGTVFRFPLRKEPSKISAEIFSPSKVEELLNDFKQISQEALLFLNNIKNITLSCINELTNKLETKYRITANLSSEDELSRADLTEHLKLFKDEPCEKITPMVRVYNLKTQDSMGIKQSWLISQMIGFDGLSKSERFSSSAVMLKKPVPRGGVAALTEHSRMQSSVVQQYKAYCLLPLPIHTNLPVHVNGTFELDSARKNLDKGDDYAREDASKGEERLVNKWNRLLVENVIAPAYAHLLKQAGRKILHEDNVKGHLKLMLNDRLMLYDNLFPTRQVQKEWLLLARATLRYISHERVDVLPVIQARENGASIITWHHPNSDTSLAFFDGFDIKPTQGAAAGIEGLKTYSALTAKTLRSFLLTVGFNLLASSPAVCLAFNASGVDQAKFVTPQAVVKHLSESEVRSTLPSPLKKTAFKDLNTFLDVFKYCLDGMTHALEMGGLPIRLTNNGTLDVFSPTEELYVTLHSNVLPHEKHRFLHKALVPSCTAWLEKNDISNEAFSSGLFKQFTLYELAKYLHAQLPKNWEGCNRHIQWLPDESGHPSQSWLADVWAFICSETSGEQSQSSLEAINSWPMLPTRCGKLVPPSLSKTVLFLDVLPEDAFGSKIYSALRKLGLPEISEQSMLHESKMQKSLARPSPTLPAPAGLIQLLKEHLAQPQSQREVAAVIQFMLKNGGVKEISLQEGDTLLRYFQEDKEPSKERFEIIKQLKIFQLLKQQKTTDLQHCEHHYTVEGYQVLMLESSKWMEKAKCVFLEPQRHLALLFDQLKVKPISHADIYLRYVLPNFSLLSQKAQLEHVKHIKDNVLPKATDGNKQEIILRLSCTPFIRDKSNIRRIPGYFFDGGNQVFKCMVDPGKLLPDYVKDLKYFLEQLGLRTTVNRDEFIIYANDVATRAKEVKDKTKREKLVDVAYLLVNEIYLNENLHDAKFLQKIAAIKFIPSVIIEAELLDIYPACSGSNITNTTPFVAYRDAVPEQYLSLVWSVSMVVPRRAIPRNFDIKKGVTAHDCLGITTGNITDKVLSHTQNVCDAMEKRNAIHKKDTLSETVRKTLESVLRKILGYIKDQITTNKNDKDIKRRLQNTPVCLVEEGHVLVRADQLVFDMEKSMEKKLRPYLYKTPRELSQFDSVFKFLGAQDSCSFDQLAGVLSAMKMECQDDALGPNEQKTAVRAVTGIFELLCRGTCPITVGELYLPTSQYILRNARQLHYADRDQMELLQLASTDKELIFPLKVCEILDKDETTLIPLLPEHLRPTNLGKDMQRKPCENNEDCIAGENCEYLEQIHRKLNSEEMTRVLHRLVQHQLKDKNMTSDAEAQIRKLQNFHKLHCKTVLKLGLFDSDGGKKAEEKYSRKAYFDACTGKIFIEHTSIQRINSGTYRQIANSCNALMGKILNSDSIGLLVIALDCQDVDEMNRRLSANQIPEYDTTAMAFQEHGHKPGTKVPSDIHHLLNPDPYNRFVEDEIVAYERCPDETNPEETEIIFAKVIEQTDKDDQTINLSQTCKIDIGKQKPIVVKVNTLYKFLRPKQQPVSSLTAYTGETTDDVPNPGFAETLPEDLHQDEELIRAEVTEVFGLPPEERRRVLKRLYRKWHPDKNIGQQERTNKAFKFLKQEIDRQERGEESSHRCSDRYDRWESEVRRDREEARCYQERYYQSRSKPTSREQTSSTNFVPPSFTKETPDPRMARLWFRQANEHFSTAKQASRQSPPPTQLIAFQIHQAAETALKAAQYSLEGKSDTGSNQLISLATKVCSHRHVSCDDLLQIVRKLDDLGCQFDKPRYPQKSSSKTSGQKYHDFDTHAALEKCQVLLKLVQDIIGINEF